MTTDTLSLTDFLTARYDEDERVWRDVAFSTRRHGKRLAQRMVADIAAKRQIVELATDAARGECDAAADRGWDVSEVDTDGGAILRHLASVYVDHPDFREEWKL